MGAGIGTHFITNVISKTEKLTDVSVMSLKFTVSDIILRIWFVLQEYCVNIVLVAVNSLPL